MPICLVPRCRSRSGDPGNAQNGIHLYRFPNRDKSPKRYDRWVRFCQLTSVSDDRAFLCSHHFRVTDIERSRLLRHKLLRDVGVKTTGPRLNSGAVPTVVTRTLKRRCYVRDCQSTDDLFPFPHRFVCNERFEAWFEFCRQDVLPSSLSGICGQHFTALDFQENSVGFRTLTSNAVPSVVTTSQAGEKTLRTAETNAEGKENKRQRQLETCRPARPVIIIRAVKPSQDDIVTTAQHRQPLDSEYHASGLIQRSDSKARVSGRLKINNLPSHRVGSLAAMNRADSAVIEIEDSSEEDEERKQREIVGDASGSVITPHCTGTEGEQGWAELDQQLKASERPSLVKIGFKQVVKECNGNAVARRSGPINGSGVQLKINNTPPLKIGRVALRNNSSASGNNNSDRLLSIISIDDSSEEDQVESIPERRPKRRADNDRRDNEQTQGGGRQYVDSTGRLDTAADDRRKTDHAAHEPETTDVKEEFLSSSDTETTPDNYEELVAKVRVADIKQEKDLTADDCQQVRGNNMTATIEQEYQDTAGGSLSPKVECKEEN